MQKIPHAATQPHTFSLHGKQHVDEYAWLQDTKNDDVKSYLKSENDYADATMRSTRTLQKKLYTEIRGRIKENDMSVPVKDGPYEYYMRTKKGKQYPIHCRRLLSSGKEEVILDENALARDSKYFALGDAEVSPDHRLLAYTVDTKGDEDHTLYIKDLTTGTLSTERIESVADALWSEDGSTIMYTKESHPYPPRQVFRHALGSDPSNDVLVYEEKDPQWYVALGKSRSREFIFIYAANYRTSEVRFLPARQPAAEPRLFAPREKEVRYGVEHHGDFFYITTNEKAVNFKIMRTAIIAPEKKHWKVWLAHEKERAIVGMDAFRDFIIFTFREGGSEELHAYFPSTHEWRHIRLPENEHSVGLNSGIEYDSAFVRFTYESFITPKTVYDYVVKTKKYIVRKEQEVPRYNKKQYVSKRLWITSGGVKVPAVLVQKRTTKKKAPLLLEAYGSYGICSDPHFSVARLSLLDRGFVYVLAHPRGGGEMGWQWHKEAYMTTKHRTGDDFVAVAEYLVKNGYTTREKLAITGGSAGGMLMGMALNARPELFGAALVYVPAADLITSLLDETLAGTRLHYDEIGNPQIPKEYKAIMRISPYENVRAVVYPAILVRASMHDIRTPYWEAAKWVARLRAKMTGTQPLLFKCELDGGHFGKSGRYEWIKQRAFDYAFLISTIARQK